MRKLNSLSHANSRNGLWAAQPAQRAAWVRWSATWARWDRRLHHGLLF